MYFVFCALFNISIIADIKYLNEVYSEINAKENSGRMGARNKTLTNETNNINKNQKT